MIFLNSIELFTYLNKQIKRKMTENYLNDIKVNISTYGISLYDQKGEYEKGNYYYEKTPAKEFLEQLEGTDTRMLVGIPPKRNYKKQSYGLSHMEYYKLIDDILKIGDTYGIDCIPSSHLHFKLYCINDIYITGGINLGNSMYNDCAVLIENSDDKERLDFLFECSWKKATIHNPLTRECKR